MKRLIAFLLALSLLFLSGCNRTRNDVTMEDIIEAYQNAGYSVWSRVYDEPLDYGEIAYVQANHLNGDYIYFAIFETPEQAKAYKDEYYHPGMMGLFSVIFGDPSWQRWKVYGCVVVQYDEPEFFDVFQELLKGK